MKKIFIFLILLFNYISIFSKTKAFKYIVSWDPEEFILLKTGSQEIDKAKLKLLNNSKFTRKNFTKDTMFKFVDNKNNNKIIEFKILKDTDKKTVKFVEVLLNKEVCAEIRAAKDPQVKLIAKDNIIALTPNKKTGVAIKNTGLCKIF